MISTRNLAELTDPPTLRKLLQSLAILDAILEPRESERAILFFDHWSIHDSVGVLRTGEDRLHIALGPDGAFIKGFVKDCVMGREGKNWPGMQSGVPRCFHEWIVHPYFEFERTTFCLWRLSQENKWFKSDVEPPLGDDPDGSAKLLKFLDGNSTTFTTWAEKRYGISIDVDAVGYILDQGFVTESILRVLNPKIAYRQLAHDLRATGYPLRAPL